MQGYDAEQAARAIAARLDRKQYPEFSREFDSLIRQAIDLDLTYMREAGVLGEGGMAGDAFYDDDEAFEFMLDAIARARGWNEEKALRLGTLLDDYMDAQQTYMEENGLLDWE